MHIRICSVILCFIVCTQLAFSQNSEKELHKLFNEYLLWQLKESPEDSTIAGYTNFNDRLKDLSFEAIESSQKYVRQLLDNAKKINRAQLSAQDAISYDILLRDLYIELDRQQFRLELMPLNQHSDTIQFFPLVSEYSPFGTVGDYENYIKRLNAYSKQIDQAIILMKRGIELKWTQPEIPLRKVIPQIERQIPSDISKCTFYKPFENIPKTFSEKDKAYLIVSGNKAIAEAVYPAFKRLLLFVKEVYLPACRQNIAVSSLPNGTALYNFYIKLYTTTNLSPKEIHELGKSEVAKIRKEMDRIIKQIEFKGSFQEFLEFLRTDPQFYSSTEEDLLRICRDIAKRADAELPKLFVELPRLPYGIISYKTPGDAIAQYIHGAFDGSRAGFFAINTYDLNNCPKYQMEALLCHEGVPGHHLQIARSHELKTLPEFRRITGYTAYVEGWGLYAESLGEEIGLYKDPYSEFGKLTMEIERACRLVVDTGIHTFGWSREQAIEYMRSNTSLPDKAIEDEVDRYIVCPGQSLAYKIGELKIKELRTKAQRELGEKFDIRKFHNAILDNGALPLDILEKIIIHWIDTQKNTKTLHQ